MSWIFSCYIWMTNHLLYCSVYNRDCKKKKFPCLTFLNVLIFHERFFWQFWTCLKSLSWLICSPSPYTAKTDRRIKLHERSGEYIKHDKYLPYRQSYVHFWWQIVYIMMTLMAFDALDVRLNACTQENLWSISGVIWHLLRNVIHDKIVCYIIWVNT